MTKKEKVKELIIETVKSYNKDWELNLDLTEFIDYPIPQLNQYSP